MKARLIRVRRQERMAEILRDKRLGAYIRGIPRLCMEYQQLLDVEKYSFKTIEEGIAKVAGSWQRDEKRQYVDISYTHYLCLEVFRRKRSKGLLSSSVDWILVLRFIIVECEPLVRLREPKFRLNHHDCLLDDAVMEELVYLPDIVANLQNAFHKQIDAMGVDGLDREEYRRLVESISEVV